MLVPHSDVVEGPQPLVEGPQPMEGLYPAVNFIRCVRVCVRCYWG